MNFHVEPVVVFHYYSYRFIFMTNVTMLSIRSILAIVLLIYFLYLSSRTRVTRKEKNIGIAHKMQPGLRSSFEVHMEKWSSRLRESRVLHEPQWR